MILPQLLGRVTLARSENPEDVAFLSNAAFMVLDQMVFDARHGGLVELLANRLTLNAATATSKLEGRLTREADIGDSYHLMALGTSRGPDGDLPTFWCEAVCRSPAHRPGGAQGHLRQGDQPRSAGAVAVQEADRRQNAGAKTRSTAYLRDNEDVSDDVRSANPEIPAGTRVG